MDREGKDDRELLSIKEGRRKEENTCKDVMLPWVTEVFLACGGNFRCRPTAEATSGEAGRKTFRVGHYKDLTETKNRARKVSGTKGNVM